MTTFNIDELGLPPGLADLIKTFDSSQPPEWFNLPVFLFYFSLQQFDRTYRYSKDYVEFGQHQTALGQVYQSGCILGHLAPNRPSDLMKLSMGKVQGDADRLFAMFKRNAEKRVRTYELATGHLPDSIPAMQIHTGYLDAGLDFIMDADRVRSFARQRMPLVDAEAFASIAFNEGIALATAQPSLWRNAMVAHDKARIELTENSDAQLLDMAAVIDSVLSLSRIWAQLCRPDLLPLIPEAGEPEVNGQAAA